MRSQRFTGASAASKAGRVVAGAVDDAVDEQGRRAQYLARSQAAAGILADPVRHRDAGPVPAEHHHVAAKLGGVPEQIAVSSAFRRWNSNSPGCGAPVGRITVIR
jgi:hypothetical protein